MPALYGLGHQKGNARSLQQESGKVMLYDKLAEYAISGTYPMHMPGHKRNREFMPALFPSDIDITEIHGFDDLSDPDSILLETTKLAVDLYGSREAFILVNGTTVGILAAIGAHTKHGDKILAVSNCHRSTPNAAELFGLEIVYIPYGTDAETGVPCSISPADIEAALVKEPDIKLVIITSPSYEGVVSDIASISEVVHNAGCLLIVDAAHGAHLGFSDAFPKSPISQGADIVVISLHKTLPALTQCSLLHVCSERADIEKTKRMLSILQTSSPSYVLMASIDYCLRLLKSDSDVLFREYERNLKHFKESVKSIKKLSIIFYDEKPHPDFYGFDPGKIVVGTRKTDISGLKLADMLRTKYHIEVERVCDDYIIAMTSICDSPEGFSRLANALCAIDLL